MLGLADFSQSSDHVGRDSKLRDGAYERLPTSSDRLTEQARSPDASPTQRPILAGELHHQIQNTLAIVLALSRLTARTVDTVEEFQTAFSQRIEAMARTNSLLLRGQIQAVSVQVALETELQPYLNDQGQVTLVCDQLDVSPNTALSLSLIFHELATNAAKYGALAKPSGRLLVECRSGPIGGVLHWCEQVSTSLKASARIGSGSLLIERLARSLGGTSRIEIREDGLNAEITFSLDNRPIQNP